jgi:hypothetical protein
MEGTRPRAPDRDVCRDRRWPRRSRAKAGPCLSKSNAPTGTAAGGCDPWRRKNLDPVVGSRQFPVMTAPRTLQAEAVRRLILATLPEPVGSNPRIFGGGAPLDSLGLVNFLADLEYRLAEEFQREIVLASARAMSRKQSPFRDTAALTDYIMELLAE